MKGIFIFIFSLLLLACSPQKRLNRLLTRHPELLQKDTVKLVDTVLTTETKVDTAFHYQSLYDTVVIEKNNTITKLFIHRDSIFLSQLVKRDTIILERKIPVEKVVQIKEEGSGIPVWIFVVMVLMLLVIGLIRSFKK